MSPSPAYVKSSAQKLIDSKGKMLVRISLGIDLSKYSELPEEERRKIVEEVSYNNSIGHDCAVDVFFTHVHENDESKDIRDRAFEKQFPDYVKGKEGRAEVND